MPVCEGSDSDSGEGEKIWSSARRRSTGEKYSGVCTSLERMGLNVFALRSSSAGGVIGAECEDEGEDEVKVKVRGSVVLMSAYIRYGVKR